MPRAAGMGKETEVCMHACLCVCEERLLKFCLLQCQTGRFGLLQLIHQCQASGAESFSYSTGDVWRPAVKSHVMSKIHSVKKSQSFSVLKSP